MKLLQEGQKITFIDTSLLSRSVDFKEYKISATVVKVINEVTAVVLIRNISHPVPLMFERTTYSNNLNKAITLNLLKIQFA